MHSSPKAVIWTPLLQLGAILSAAGSLFFWYLYFTLYWPYRGLFNGQGRYFDQDSAVLHHEQSGVLVVPALALLALAVLCTFSWRARHRGRAVGA